MDKFYCTKCFYLTSDDVPPEECPICHSPFLYFDPIVKNEKQFIPEYWNDYLDKKIEEIHKNQIKAGTNSSSFALITDLHWASNEKHSAAILKKVMDDCGIPFFFNGGDVVCGSGICPASSLTREISEFNEAFIELAEKCIPVQGNHDACYSTFPIPMYYKESLKKAEMYEYYFRPYTQYKNHVFGPDGFYCYADDLQHKMRYISINTFIKYTDELREDGLPVCDGAHTTGIMQEQLDWLAHVALDVPSPDWTVVVCSHIPLYYMSANFGVAMGICDAFRKHTKYSTTRTDENRPNFNVEIDVDFTGRGGDLAIWVGGHTHFDETRITTSGIISTATLNDSIHNDSHSEFLHTKGTVTEHAFDVFTIDKNNHKIYTTRIGCGENREFEYEVF